MIAPFGPGQLTASQAAKLNELWEFRDRMTRMTARPPFVMQNAGGVPIVAAESPQELLLCEVTASDAATPPVHTAKRKTRADDNTIADYSPESLYENVLDPTEAGFAVGTLVGVTQFPDQLGYRWAWAASGGDCCGWGADYFTSRRKAGGLIWPAVSEPLATAYTGASASAYAVCRVPAGSGVVGVRAGADVKITLKGQTAYDVVLNTGTRAWFAAAYLGLRYPSLSSGWAVVAEGAPVTKAQVLVFDQGGVAGNYAATGDYVGASQPPLSGFWPFRAKREVYVVLPPADRDAELTWLVAVGGEHLPAADLTTDLMGFGHGGTYVQWDAVCCPDDAEQTAVPIPDAGPGVGLSLSGGSAAGPGVGRPKSAAPARRSLTPYPGTGGPAPTYTPV